MTASFEFEEGGLGVICVSLAAAAAAGEAVANVDEAGGGTEELARAGSLV